MGPQACAHCLGADGRRAVLGGDVVCEDCYLNAEELEDTADVVEIPFFVVAEAQLKLPLQEKRQ